MKNTWKSVAALTSVSMVVSAAAVYLIPKGDWNELTGGQKIQAATSSGTTATNAGAIRVPDALAGVVREVPPPRPVGKIVTKAKK